MELFLKFLIVYLDSFDCNKGSLEFLRNIGFMSKQERARNLMNKIYYGFTMMKVRIKVSYEATLKGMTIKEVFLRAILKSYFERMKLDLIPNPYPVPDYCDLFKQLEMHELSDFVH